jgi:3-deoxy-manno-octulosonate cytidylyltransferase (CMP-KDO synthetase)
MKVVVVIPARYESTRFPGKPLTDILGKTMLLRVYEKCTSVVPATDVYVATDDARILDYCAGQNIQAVLTSKQCLTGTDRVAEFAELVAADVYVNVQGDEPVFNPADIELLLQIVQQDPDKVYGGYCAIDSEEMYLSKSVPKMVMDLNKRLMYMSRQPIPGNKAGEFKFAYRQVCAYAFPAASLKIYKGQTSKTPLEQEEDLELLRFLELGYPVNLIEMSKNSIAVDHPEDLLKVIERLTHDSE